MHEHEFDALGERLLCSGIAPRHVRRLLGELGAHYAQLLEDESSRGRPAGIARSVARQRLGSDDEIVRTALRQPALKSWGARWPAAVFGLAPLLGLAASAILTIAALGLAIDVAGKLSPGSFASADHGARWARGTAAAGGWLVLYGLPLLWAAVIARYSLTRRLGRVWPVTGLVLVTAIWAATNFGVALPHDGIRGSMTAGIGFHTEAWWLVRFGTRALLTAALGIAFGYLLSRPQSSWSSPARQEPPIAP